MPANDDEWVHRNYVCLLVKETDWALSLHNIFCRFLNFPPDFYQRNRNNTSCAYYKVYGVDKLSNNWDLYKAESTHPESTLCLLSVENMVAFILWWLAITFKWKVFVEHVFRLRDIQYSSKYRSIGVIDEEGLKLVWRCSASARPTFQSRVTVYNHARCSRITTCFLWTVYIHNRQ